MNTYQSFLFVNDLPNTKLSFQFPKYPCKCFWNLQSFNSKIYQFKNEISFHINRLLYTA
jgi:hypothetical protein